MGSTESRKTPEQDFAALWDDASSVPNVFFYLKEHADLASAEKLHVVLEDQRRRHELGIPLSAEIYLSRFPELSSDPGLKLEVIYGEFSNRRNLSEDTALDDIGERFPESKEALLERIAVATTEGRHAGASDDPGEPPISRDDISIGDLFRTDEWDELVRGILGTEDDPKMVARYRLEKALGRGTFGVVYLAHDEELRRLVAIKVSHRIIANSPQLSDMYHSEGQILANLDHPGVVTVHDVGTTEDGRGYIVEQFIRGQDLAGIIREARPSYRRSASIVSAVAEALHYVHQAGLIHRDIKPANILVDNDGKPYITDFGLALREEDFGKRSATGGTIAYMSPEQVRGEGHLVDIRSDVYSLGVVLHELLTGKLPYRGSTREEIIEAVQKAELVPPRELDGSIPPELERICRKALSRHPSDRHSDALTLAQELRAFVSAADTPARVSAPGSFSGVLPKGLRSFDAEDADFFLDLLPGPRDQHGFPGSIRFWKNRIETADPANAFRVGWIYGPSGCGKSSLVKAGLLPRLAGHVTAVFIEATADRTEEQMLEQLRSRFPGLKAEPRLIDVLTKLRRGSHVPRDHKVLLVLDQFEQWLHARHDIDDSELVRALRQCDGVRLQCLCLVREEFWMAVTRFMGELDIPLVEGSNFLPVDLFGIRHAQQVLTAFGRAFGVLPARSGDLSRGQREFVEQAVAGLARNRRIIPIRLALFSEMVKDEEWALDTLKRLGGTEGVGMVFLEKTFDRSTEHPRHRLYGRAARQILRTLLPEPGRDLRGNARSRQELLEAFRRERSPGDFDEVLRFLESDVRLVVPVELDGGGQAEAQDRSSERYYQLAHEYLIPSLRAWLMRHQRASRRGRARLVLAERAALWAARPERRQLPSFLEWLSILLLTSWKRWTAPEAATMRAASKLHLAWIAVAVVTVALLQGGVGYTLERWKVRHALDAARDFWAEGPETWDRACEYLDRVRGWSPGEPELIELLREVSGTATLVVSVEPGVGREATVRVEPDLESGRALGYPLEPRLMDSRAGAVFRAGEEVHLAPGHYFVSVSQGLLSCRFPVFVGQVVYEKSGKHWVESSRVLPAGVQEQSPPGEVDAGKVRFAEKQVLPLLPLVKAPSGYSFANASNVRTEFAYVNPGIAWCAELPDLSRRTDLTELGGPARDVIGMCSESLRPVLLEHGFFIAKDEVSVGEMESWYGRYHQDLSEHHDDCEIMKKQRAAIGIPPDILAAHWGLPYDDTTLEIELAEAAREEICRQHWDAHPDGFETVLSDVGNILRTEADERLPARSVSWEIAVAYARTFAAVPDLAQFTSWLERERASRLEREAVLERLASDVRNADGRLVAAANVRQDIRVQVGLGLRDRTREVDIVLAYFEWLYFEPFLALQVPIECLARWVEAEWADAEGSQLRQVFPEGVAKFVAELRSNPRLDLKQQDIHPEEANLVRMYASAMEMQAVSPRRGEILLDRDHFSAWIAHQTYSVRKQRETFERALRSARARTADENGAAPVDLEIPFYVRLEYGRHEGWGLPTLRQWEKAARGADARKYPWGDAAEFLNAQLGPNRGGPDWRSRARTTLDRSPYDVWGMGGNVSEWVENPPELGFRQVYYRFLKGGNYYNMHAYADLGCTIGLKDQGRRAYFGLRPIRVIRSDTAGSIDDVGDGP